ncbi:MAG TPA: alkaline phytoceramidase [archaeon]|nr:alkaline phytoceramidase [archaeon]
MSKKYRLRLLFIGVLSFAVALSAFFLPRIPQDTSYHHFADQRTFFGITNFLDVFSNVLFVLAGGLGCRYLIQRIFSNSGNSPESRLIYLFYLVFFTGAFLTGFGSIYYHLAPDTSRLFWDRLPMTIVFMSFLSAIIAERIGLRIGLALFLPLLGLGMGSIIYWDLGEQVGRGDLSFYILVQFYPLVLIPLILFLFPPKYTRGWDFAVVLLFYALAKAGEALDWQIFALGHLISGHSVKHLLAALAVYWVLRMLRTREYLGEKSGLGDG